MIFDVIYSLAYFAAFIAIGERATPLQWFGAFLAIVAMAFLTAK
jgi:drug/metabolite transporter (DMT)-like permease